MGIVIGKTPIGKTPNESHNQIYFEPKEQFAGIVERSISATACHFLVKVK